MKRAVVLLSGGLDSATVAAVAVRDGFEVHALSFRYGQRHAHELRAAARVANALRLASHRVFDLDLRAFGGSALTAEIDVPKDRAPAELGEGIPITYVPARNTIFLSVALALAEVLAATDIYLGVNALDYSGYPDCRPEFIEAFQNLARYATRMGPEGQPIRIRAPLVHLAKAQIIALGLDLGVDYSLTSSCYDPSGEGHACGRCDSCQLRKRGFEANSLADPITYAAA